MRRGLALGVTDRALTVLDALLTFYPDDEISEEKGLIVFPSNAQLSLRARGMTLKPPSGGILPSWSTPT